MDKLEKFLEFIRENPPPCFFGESTYWFEKETGRIRLETKSPITKLSIDIDGNWLITYEADGEFYKPNESAYDCLTYEDAKKFRDEIGTVKYVIYVPELSSDFKYNGQGYNSLDTKEFPVSCMEREDSYIDTILREENGFIAGTIIEIIPTDSIYDKTFFLIFDNNQYEEIGDFEPIV